VVERDFASPDFKLHQLGCILKTLRHAQYTGSGFYERLGTMLSSVVVANATGRTTGRESTPVRTEDLKKSRKAVTLNDLNNIAFVYSSLK